MAATDLITQIQAVVGGDYVIDHPEDLLVYEYDGSVDRSMPRAVVLPVNTEQASQVISLAYAAGVAVVGRGSGTGLSGGAITPPDGLQIAFPRMNRILNVDTANRTALVEPGVINLDLDIHVRKFGMRYAPDPSSQRACSLGGNIAENAGGPHCLAYGTTTNHVIGMEVILEDGQVGRVGWHGPRNGRLRPTRRIRRLGRYIRHRHENPWCACCPCRNRCVRSWAYLPTLIWPAPQCQQSWATGSSRPRWK